MPGGARDSDFLRAPPGKLFNLVSPTLICDKSALHCPSCSSSIQHWFSPIGTLRPFLGI
jgi:hypothetical protein